jgi:hypothetical protein
MEAAVANATLTPTIAARRLLALLDDDPTAIRREKALKHR